jgi:predicted RNA binding protein YcfA (HicA-like mRNA interferase family)
MPVTGKQLAKALVRNGWVLLRVNGSHHIFGKTGVRERISVPIHGNEELRPGLLAHLLKMAGLSESDVD